MRKGVAFIPEKLKRGWECGGFGIFLKSSSMDMFIDERERERNIDWFPLYATLTGDLNLVMGPDQESNSNLLMHGTMLQPTEPPGQNFFKKGNTMNHIIRLNQIVIFTSMNG